MPDQEQLYVKLEGHDDLRQELRSINHVINNIEEASDVLDDIRQVKHKTIQNIQENILELNQRIENIYGQIPAVEDQKIPADTNKETEIQEQNNEIDESVNELHDQLKTLKDELHQIE
mgnify:CR=1 FL=1